MKRLAVKKTAPISMIVMNDTMEIHSLDVTFSLVTDYEAYDDLVVAQLEQGISLSKCIYFLSAVLNGSVLYEPERSGDVDPIVRAFGNNPVLAPDTTDATLIALITAKLSSLCVGDTSVEMVELRDKHDGLGYELLCLDGDQIQDDDLPNLKDWMGQWSRWKNPWWFRNDALTWDQAASSEAELAAWNRQAKEDQLKGNQDDHTRMLEVIEQQMREQLRDIQATTGQKTDANGEIIEVDFAGSKRRSLH